MSSPASGFKSSHKLQSRIVLVMGSILFLFVLILGYSIYQLTILSRSAANGEGSFKQIGTTVRQIEASLREARNIELQIPGLSDKSAAQRFASAMAPLRGQLPLLRLFYQDIENRQAVQATDTLAGLAEQYRQGFQDKITAVPEEKPTDIDTLRSQLEEAAQKLAHLAAGENNKVPAGAVLELGSYQDAYMDDPVPASYARLQDRLAEVEEQLDTSQAEPERKRQLQNAIATYRTALDRHYAVSLATEDSSLSAAFSAERQRQRHVMEQSLRRIEELMVRKEQLESIPMVEDVLVNTEQFLAGGEEKYAILANTALDELDAALADSSLDESRRREVSRAAQRFRELFNTFVSRKRETAATSGQLDDLFNSMEKTIASLPVHSPPAAKGFDLSVMRSHEEILYPAIAGIAALLAGCIAVLALGRSVSGSLRRMTGQVQAIRSGGRQEELSALAERKDELGNLAAAVNELLGRLGEDRGEPAAHAAADGGDAEQDVSGAAVDTAPDLAALALSLGALQSRLETLQQKASALSDRQTDEESAVDQCAESMESAMHILGSMTRTAEDAAGVFTANSELAEQTSVAALNAAIKAAKNEAADGGLTGVIEKLDALAKRSREAARELSSHAARNAELTAEAVAAGDASNRLLAQLAELDRERMKQVADISGSLEELAAEASAVQKLVDERDGSGSRAGEPAEAAGPASPGGPAHQQPGEQAAAEHRETTNT